MKPISPEAIATILAQAPTASLKTLAAELKVSISTVQKYFRLAGTRPKLGPSQADRLQAALQQSPEGLKLETILTMFWPIAAPENWRTVIAIRMSQLRRRGLIITCKAGTYRLMEEPNGDKPGPSEPMPGSPGLHPRTGQ